MTVYIPYGSKGIEKVNDTCYTNRESSKRLNECYKNKTPIVILHPLIWDKEIKKDQLINCLSIGYAIEYD